MAGACCASGVCTKLRNVHKLVTRSNGLGVHACTLIAQYECRVPCEWMRLGGEGNRGREIVADHRPRCNACTWMGFACGTISMPHTVQPSERTYLIASANVSTCVKCMCLIVPCVSVCVWSAGRVRGAGRCVCVCVDGSAANKPAIQTWTPCACQPQPLPPPQTLHSCELGCQCYGSFEPEPSTHKGNLYQSCVVVPSPQASNRSYVVHNHKGFRLGTRAAACCGSSGASCHSCRRAYASSCSTTSTTTSSSITTAISRDCRHVCSVQVCSFVLLLYIAVDNSGDFVGRNTAT